MPREYKDSRQKDLAIIHANRKALQLDDDAYRDYLESLTGKRSSAELGHRQRKTVIASMQKLVGNDKERRTTRPRAADDRKPLLSKVYALLYAQDRPISYAEGILKQMFGQAAPAKLEWATPEQVHKVVASMVYQGKREAKKNAD